MSKLLEGLSGPEREVATQLANHLAYYAMKGESPPGGLGAILNKAPPAIRGRIGKLLEVLDMQNSAPDGESVRSLNGGISKEKVTKADLAQALGLPAEALEALLERFLTERATSKVQARMGTDASGGHNEKQLHQIAKEFPELLPADLAKPQPITRRDQVAAAMAQVTDKVR